MTTFAEEERWASLATALGLQVVAESLRGILLNQFDIRQFIEQGGSRSFDKAVQKAKTLQDAFVPRTPTPPAKPFLGKERDPLFLEHPQEVDGHDKDQQGARVESNLCEVIAVSLAVYVERTERKRLEAVRAAFGMDTEPTTAAIYAAVTKYLHGWRELFPKDPDGWATSLLHDLFGEEEDPNQVFVFDLLGVMKVELKALHPVCSLLRFSTELQKRIGWDEVSSLGFLLTGYRPTNYERISVRYQAGEVSRLNRLILCVDPTTPDDQVRAEYRKARERWLACARWKAPSFENAVVGIFAHETEFATMNGEFDRQAVKAAWEERVLSQRGDFKLHRDFPRQARGAWAALVHPPYRPKPEVGHGE